MKDTTSAHHDTDLCEESPSQNRANSPDAADKPENGAILADAQAAALGHLSDADTKVLAAIDDHGSLEDLGKLLAVHRPELLFWGGRDFLLRGQKHLAKDTNAKLPPVQEEEDDIQLQTRTATYKRIKQEVAILDRLFQCACSAADITDAVKGAGKLQEDTFIRSLDARQEIPGQGSLSWGT